MPNPTLPPNEGHVYQTANGMKTVAQMRTELRTAGWPNWRDAVEADVARAYAHTTGSAATMAQAPMPYQINPIVWDSMSDTARQLFLGMAELGQTRSGAWTRADYLNQFNASRPQGQAPKQIQHNWNLNNQSYF